MTTALAKQDSRQAVCAPSGTLFACPACSQEMRVPDDELCLPLHMALGALCAGSYAPGAPPKFGQEIREPLTIADVGQLSVSEIVSADTCLACGGNKARGQTLCARCHGLLPFPLSQALPTHLKGYLFSDEQKLIAGHYSKKEFKGVFQFALTALFELRGGGEQCPPN